MAVGSVSARNGIAEEIGQNVNGSVEPVFLFGREDDQEDAINHCGNLMRRIANIIGIALLVVVVIGVAIYASIPDRSPPEGFKQVAPVGVRTAETAHEVSERAGDEEILLDEP